VIPRAADGGAPGLPSNGGGSSTSLPVIVTPARLTVGQPATAVGVGSEVAGLTSTLGLATTLGLTTMLGLATAIDGDGGLMADGLGEVPAAQPATATATAPMRMRRALRCPAIGTRSSGRHLWRGPGRSMSRLLPDPLLR
jgi:hypothetical protein